MTPAATAPSASTVIEKTPLKPAEAAQGVGGLTNLVGMTREQLTEEIVGLGEAPFRARQLWHWIYHRGERDFAAMTTLAKDFRAKLAEHFTLARPEAVRDDISSDGTRKWLFRFADGQEVETVHIPEEDRGTLCVSSQVGCSLACAFCHTGTQQFVRNLSSREIVAQVMAARDALGEWPSPKSDRMISNIVMMGMGEPLLNFENVKKALGVVMDSEGIAISRRRITLSTAGVVPLMDRCGSEIGVNLAVSLHAVSDPLRDVLVPINRRFPLKELLAACRRYPGANNARRITFEYVMLKGVNDRPEDARALARLLKGVHAKTNLIPFNPWPGSDYETSSPDAVEAFARILNDAGLAAPVRQPRGRDILAACGQLRTDSQRRRKSAPAA
ncbi:MAG TPA: 23S rRNA (adenine(2503)-C(2))-methyltransferase RlmN [Alphaproteobacteria bacterium]|jgi:23S rRNA (adenine2503-C2)-methyltransferase|nr:23S rRNA (adenine(2503)-C(2))-methyltransferase RlmN [Alphaproteobacteria bacterium]